LTYKLQRTLNAIVA